MKASALDVAVIGAGWAGCAAAVELTLRGHRVRLIEASRFLGGRARGLRQPGSMGADDAWESRLDNGQHILLGAYAESLRMMRAVGIDPKTALLRLPLQMRYPPGSGGMDFVGARLPAPLHLLVALLRTRGLDRADKMALARFTSAARWIDWRLAQDCSVAELLDRFDQTARVILLLWRPLCLAALNTPPERASAQVFLNVLRDSLGARRAASDMLIPRVDLGSLFPLPAARFIAQQGGAVNLGFRVSSLVCVQRRWYLNATPDTTSRATTAARRSANVDADMSTEADTSAGTKAGATVGADISAGFDAVILATPSAETVRLLAAPGVGMTTPPLATETSYEPITTCYLQYASSLTLDQPFYALIDAPEQNHWGQFVFDRGQLDPEQAGLLAVVISAASDATALTHRALGAMIAAQLAAVFGNPQLASPHRVKIISEKRATFSCTPGLFRPDSATGLPGLFRAGDHVASDYPATIESAVRSGVRAARLVDAG